MNRSCIVPFFTTAALLIATIGAARTIAQRSPEELAQPLSTIDAEITGWRVTSEQTLDARVLGRLLPTAYLQRTYSKNDADIDVFVAYYAEQKAGESMHSPKHCLPGSGWEIWQHGSADVPVNGKKERINQYGIENSGHRMLMFYWYQSGPRIVASEYMGKILLARDTLTTGRTAAAIVRVAIRDKPGAAEEGAAFAAALIPQVERCFVRH